jgi:hypothetical protein
VPLSQCGGFSPIPDAQPGIEAFAGPSPPRPSDEDLKHDHRAESERLIERMRDLSEQELDSARRLGERIAGLARKLKARRQP